MGLRFSQVLLTDSFAKNSHIAWSNTQDWSVAVRSPCDCEDRLCGFRAFSALDFFLLAYWAAVLPLQLQSVNRSGSHSSMWDRETQYSSNRRKDRMRL